MSARSSSLGLVLLLAVAGLGGRSARAAPPTPAAWEHLETLGRLLAHRAATNEEILGALDAATASYVELRAGPPAAAETEDDRKERERFFQRTEDLVVSALGSKRVAPKSNENDRHPIQVRAARALGLLRPVAAPRAMQVLSHDIFKDQDYERLPRFYEAAFSSLARMGAKGVFEWLLEEAVTADTDGESERRTLAALRAMMSVRPVAARSRFEALKRIVAIFQMFDFAGWDDYDELTGLPVWKKPALALNAGTTLITFWLSARSTVLAALRQFCTDPRTLAPPLDPETGKEIVTIARYMTWFRAHVWKERTSPWMDGAPPETDRTGSRAEGRVPPPDLNPIWRKYGVPWEAWCRWTHALESGRPAPAPVTTAEKPSAPVPAFLDTLRKQTLPQFLRAALSSPDPEIRAVACMTLGKLGEEGAVKLLHARLAEDVSERVREAASLGLLLLRDPAEKEALWRLVDDAEENPRVRGYAVLALGFLGEVNALRERFAADRPRNDARKPPPEDLLACAAVARAIAREPGCSAEFLDLIRREKASDEVRGAAGSALARVADAKVMPDLLRILEDPRRREETQVAQVAAALALETALTADDGPSWRVLRSLVQGAKGRFAHSRDLVFLALGRAGGLAAREVLTEAYADCAADTQRRAELGYILLAIGRVGTSEARSDLRARFRELDHERDAAACAVASAIASDPLAISPIRERLAQSKKEFTAYGIAALGMLGDSQAVELIRSIVERRSDPTVITSAALSLARLLGEGAVADLRSLWDRCMRPEEFDAVAWAFRPAAGPKAVEALLEIYSDGNRPAIERALALAALGRIADPEPAPLLQTLGLHFNPYAGSGTLASLADHLDVPFLY